jgi:hypothetical protein
MDTMKSFDPLQRGWSQDPLMELLCKEFEEGEADETESFYQSCGCRTATSERNDEAW